MEEILRIPSVPYEPSTVRRQLDHGRPTLRLDCRLTGTIDQSAGTDDDAAFFPDAIARLIRGIHVLADDFRLIDGRNVDLRTLIEYHRLNVVQVVPPVEPEETSGEVDDSAFELIFSIHFARQYLLNPVETILPPLPLRNGLYLDVDWETSRVNGASDPGTGGMMSAGGDTYTFTTAPRLEIDQVTAPDWARADRRPFAIPALRAFTAPTFTGADSDLVTRFTNRKRFDLLLFRQSYSADDLLENSIERVTLRGSDTVLLDERRAWAMVQEAVGTWPAFNGPGASDQVGYLPFLAAKGGRLRQAVNPDDYVDLHLKFDVAAPTSGTGRIRILQGILQPWRGVTVLQP